MSQKRETSKVTSFSLLPPPISVAVRGAVFATTPCACSTAEQSMVSSPRDSATVCPVGALVPTLSWLTLGSVLFWSILPALHELPFEQTASQIRNEPDPAEVMLVAVATSAYWPCLLMVRLLKLATPFRARTEVVPPRTAPGSGSGELVRSMATE